MDAEEPKAKPKQKGNPNWKPGVSGNPKGRKPKGSALTDILKQYLDEHIEGDERTRGEAFVFATYAAAIRGGQGARREIWQYGVGLPTQRIVVSSEDTDIHITIKGKDEEAVAENVAHIMAREKEEEVTVPKQKMDDPKSKFLIDLYKNNPAMYLAAAHHRTHKNRRITFNRYEYMLDIYMDTSPYIVIGKSTQLGATEYLIVNAIAKAYMQGRGVFYVMPTYSLMNRFVNNRFNRSVDYTDEYKRMVSEGDPTKAMNLSLKHFGKGAIAFVGSNAANAFTEFPADDVIVDEYDQCDQTNLPMAEERLSASADKRRIYVSNPTILDFGIDTEYKKSDRKRWHIRCPHCNKWNQPDFFAHVVREVAPREFVIRDPDYDADSGNDCAVICEKCGKPLDRFVAGEWVPEQKSEISGYTMNKLFTTNVTIRDLLARFDEGLSNDIKLQRFYNGDLGVAYTATGAKITKEMLDACECDYSMGETGSGYGVMGIDVGTRLHVIVGEAISDGRTRVVYIGDVDDFPQIEELRARYNVKVGLVDAMPETRLSKRICYFRGFARCFYSGSAKTDKVDTRQRIVTVDRTSTLDGVKEAILTKQLMLPRNAHACAPLDKSGLSEYYMHMMASTRYYDETKKAYVWSEGSKPDHLFHATNYMLIARRMLATLAGE